MCSVGVGVGIGGGGGGGTRVSTASTASWISKLLISSKELSGVNPTTKAFPTLYSFE